jgi:DNA-binding NarL/FixJ family response regulator
MNPLSGRANKRISVLVASADRMGAELIAEDLRRHQRRFQLVDTADTSAEALRRIHEHKPDIALINASLGDGPSQGYVLLRELRVLKGKTKAIVMIPSCERNLVIDAFREGARGVFCRDHSSKLLGRKTCAPLT